MIEIVVIIALPVPLLGFLAGTAMAEFSIGPYRHVRRVASLMLAVLRDLAGPTRSFEFPRERTHPECGASLSQRRSSRSLQLQWSPQEGVSMLLSRNTARVIWQVVDGQSKRNHHNP